MKALLQRLQRALSKPPKPPKLHRAQEKFRTRYPSYQVGTGTYGMPEVHDWNEGSTLRIGAYCSIAGDVHIYLGGHHRIDWVSSFPFPAFTEEAAHIADHGGTRGDVEIGSDVWLCSQSIILSGVKIGHGAVVAAGSVVSRDVAPYSVVAGNPARHVRWRFDEAQRDALLQIAWWDWPEHEVRQAIPMLCSSQIDDFITQARRRSGEC
ncbi:CatB-related O-acetyltransferase [Pseudomonas sp. Gutcm_11s]|uniref:CatB-related O-acetyltransferase n=1 Tax=Pseudomonas sp. Gutcm_11s TaxID=3026088 RepID=UPI002360D5F5|nr:CatB-related O-acetyltransferase [Pseudomonas sp. Gutcm_11s]MDD0842932.1 CatB-related O-acetyltransferase [Pseudomonas sp. Gutcm_11s]